MNRVRTLLFLLGASILLLPAGQAQSSVDITTIRILNSQGDELRIASLDQFVNIEVTVNNTGSSTIDGPLTLNLTIESTDGSYKRAVNVNRPGPMTPGNSTVFTYSWSPNGREVGEHRVVARMTSPSSAEGLVATFEVAENEVLTGNIVDRTLSYYWVFGLFLLAVIVFFVVLTARRS